jgi:hypothetical protein
VATATTQLIERAAAQPRKTRTPAKEIHQEEKRWLKTFVRAPLLPHLERWKRKTGGAVLGTFCAEILEVAIIGWIRNEPEFSISPRRGSLPRGSGSMTTNRPRIDGGDAHKTKLNASHEEKIRRLLAEDLPIAQIAIRFAIAQSTVRRIHERMRWEREQKEEL